jgi:hypothetical protein
MMAGDAGKTAHPVRVSFGLSESFLSGNAAGCVGRKNEVYFSAQTRPSALCHT